MSLLRFSNSKDKTPRDLKNLKVILGIGALVGVIALGSTLAASINLNSGTPVEFGQGVAQATACDSEILVTPISKFINSESSGGFKFSGISISGLDTTDQSGSTQGCSGKTFVIKSYNASGELLDPSYSISVAASEFTSPDGIISGDNFGEDGSVTLTFTSANIAATDVYNITFESTEAELGINGGLNHYFNNNRMVLSDWTGDWATPDVLNSGNALNSSGMPVSVAFHHLAVSDPDFSNKVGVLTNGQALQLVIGVGGTSSAWNVDGDILRIGCHDPDSDKIYHYCPGDGSGETGLTTFDYSKVLTIPGPAGLTYGTAVSTTTISFGGYDLEIRNTFTLAQNSSFIKITSRIKNVGTGTVTNLRAWGEVNDAALANDDQDIYLGHLLNSNYQDLGGGETGFDSNAIHSNRSNLHALMYSSTANGANSSYQCCENNSILTNPLDQNGSNSNIENGDASYSLYFRLHDLAPGASHQFTWMLGATSDNFSALASAMYSARTADVYTP